MFGQSVHASRSERERALPGDDLIGASTASLTHAVTIRRPRRDIWPWLVQMGAGRAGWYSYDTLDNGRKHSAERIVPELQHIHIGAIMPAMPGVTDGFAVLSFEPERFLIIGWVPDGAAPMMTWAFVLEEVSPECTRLVVRARGGSGYRPPFGIPVWAGRKVMPAIHFIMQRKQLLEIARRAESHIQLATGMRRRI
jgi:hypothetical protein